MGPRVDLMGGCWGQVQAIVDPGDGLVRWVFGRERRTALLPASESDGRARFRGVGSDDQGNRTVGPRKRDLYTRNFHECGLVTSNSQ